MMNLTDIKICNCLAMRSEILIRNWKLFTLRFDHIEKLTSVKLEYKIYLLHQQNYLCGQKSLETNNPAELPG
jgi:hypothetical protein